MDISPVTFLYLEVISLIVLAVHKNASTRSTRLLLLHEPSNPLIKRGRRRVNKGFSGLACDSRLCEHRSAERKKENSHGKTESD